MKNISFDNPYLLLLLIPLLLAIIIPIALAIRKENNSKSVVASFIMHIAIALCIALAIGGLVITQVNTKTQVYVVADVSYSANRNLDQVDAYIRQIEEALPRNSEMAVVVFAKEYKLLTEMGEKFTSVKDHGMKNADIAATDISSPLNYVSTMFDKNAIKRVILITDGKQTRSDAAGELASAVDNLYANNIAIDAVFLDSNLPEDVAEVQISDVDFAPVTYKGHKSTANILIQSSTKTDNVILTFSIDGVAQKKEAISLEKGYNLIHYDLPTDIANEDGFNYRFSISAGADGTTNNNAYEFVQAVAEKMKVLLVTWSEADVDKVKQTYGEGAEVDVYLRNGNVPCTVEELCVYDEIVLSNFDIRNLGNVTSFIDSIDTVVSQYGKSLITMGDLRIQNKDEELVLKQLEDMLPVKFGNSDQDPKLYAIVIDSSRSMGFTSKLHIAKQTATYLLNLLDDDDYVMVVNFHGNVEVLQAPVRAERREEVIERINSLTVTQGTMIGTALDKAGELMIDMAFDEKEIMLISDGKSFTNEKDTPADIAAKLYSHGIHISTIYPGIPQKMDHPEEYPGWTTMNEIAKAGGGKYFGISTTSDIEDVVFNEVADELTDSVINEQSAVNIHAKNDDVIAGISVFPDVYGYTYAKIKPSATTVLTVDYYKSSDTERKNPVQAPLYAYWNYGNGKVSTFTSTISGDWTEKWNADAGNRFFSNVTATNIPAERIDYPFDLNVEYDGTFSRVEVIPSTLNPNATVEVTITMPGEIKITETLEFDSTRYAYEFETPTTGVYTIDISYNYHKDKEPFTCKSVFSIPYSPEYNMFEVFDPSVLHAAIRDRGTVSENGIPNLENDESMVDTSSLRMVAPLMILAVVLYVVDIIVRKLTIADIKSFFGIKSKRGVGK